MNIRAIIVDDEPQSILRLQTDLAAFDKYMIDALRASAFDFLLKPYKESELKMVVERIRQKMSEPKTCLHGLAQELQTLEGVVSKQVAVQTISGLLMVRAED